MFMDSMGMFPSGWIPKLTVAMETESQHGDICKGYKKIT